MDIDIFFSDHEQSKELYDRIDPIIRSLGEVEIRVSKSQIAYHRRRGFAWVWIPEKHLRRPAAPLVLTLTFYHRDPSPRWKEIVEPYPGRFTHHLEIYSAGQIDDEVRGWIKAAWTLAGSTLQRNEP